MTTDAQVKAEHQLRVEQFAELRKRYGVHKMMELMDHRDWDVVFDELARLRAALAAAQAEAPKSLVGLIDHWGRGFMAGVEAARAFCSIHTVYYRGIEPIKLIRSATGEPIGDLYAKGISALRPPAETAESDADLPTAEDVRGIIPLSASDSAGVLDRAIRAGCLVVADRSAPCGWPSDSCRKDCWVPKVVCAAMAAEPAGPSEDVAQALKPFADVGQWLFARDLPDDTPAVELMGINGMNGALTQGDFKKAHTMYMALLQLRKK